MLMDNVESQIGAESVFENLKRCGRICQICVLICLKKIVQFHFFQRFRGWAASVRIPSQDGEKLFFQGINIHGNILKRPLGKRWVADGPGRQFRSQPVSLLRER